MFLKFKQFYLINESGKLSQNYNDHFKIYDKVKEIKKMTRT